MSKQVEVTLTANEVMGVSQGLAFLSSREVKELSVEIMWDVVEAISKIRTSEEAIRELGQKINKEFYEEYETKDGERSTRLIKGKSEEFNEANKQLGDKTFKFKLSQIELSKIKDIKGLTGTHIIGLRPILKK